MVSKTKTQFMTCAGPIEFVTGEQFIEILCEKDKQHLSDKIADVEILGLENDGKSPVIRKVYLDYSQNNPFGGFIDSDDHDYAVESAWKTEKVKLAVITGDYVAELKNQLEKIIYFKERDISTETIGFNNAIADICEELSINSLENFGNPTHFIDFGNNKYAVVCLEDMNIECCVYNKQVRAGIIINKVTAFGAKVKNMK